MRPVPVFGAASSVASLSPLGLLLLPALQVHSGAKAWPSPVSCRRKRKCSAWSFASNSWAFTRARSSCSSLRRSLWQDRQPLRTESSAAAPAAPHAGASAQCSSSNGGRRRAPQCVLGRKEKSLWLLTDCPLIAATSTGETLEEPLCSSIPAGGGNAAGGGGAARGRTGRGGRGEAGARGVMTAATVGTRGPAIAAAALRRLCAPAPPLPRPLGC
mmetsp:Transcript_82188/g.228010  ORF Transcript_82188/g.228010 Transcript_82188/m.228010 type:complete len:215 (+) Transcript_82188:361-1005(+)